MEWKKDDLQPCQISSHIYIVVLTQKCYKSTRLFKTARTLWGEKGPLKVHQHLKCVNEADETGFMSVSSFNFGDFKFHFHVAFLMTLFIDSRPNETHTGLTTTAQYCTTGTKQAAKPIQYEFGVGWYPDSIDTNWQLVSHCRCRLHLFEMRSVRGWKLQTNSHHPKVSKIASLVNTWNAPHAWCMLLKC